MWAVAWVVASVWLIYDAVVDSRANIENDPSSMAWVGFLPFLFPIFFIQSGVFIWPIAGVVESVLFFRRWSDKQDELLESEHETVE